MQVPHLYAEVVARDHVAAAIAQLHIANGTDDLAEEAPVPWVLWLLELFRVPVAQGRRPHVAQPNGALAARVHEQVALGRMELGGRDHLRQLLHVRRLDVHDVEALVRDLQVPQVDAQVVG